MAHTLIQRLREYHPECEIDLFANSWVTPVFECMKEVRRTIYSPFHHGELCLNLRRQMGRALSQENYDQAIILPNTFKSALLPFFADIPLRSGFVGEMRYLLLNDVRHLDKVELPLMVERYAFLAEPPGATLRRPLPLPRMTVDAAHRQATLDRLGLQPSRPVAALCVGAERGPAKRWPARHFAHLAQLLGGRFEIWLLGSKHDMAIGESILNQCQGAVINLCGKTDLSEAIDLIDFCDLVVSNDSGLMHIAAALNRPLVALYGSTTPEFTPPLSKKAQIVLLGLTCRPCHKRICPLGHTACLEEMTPERVLEEIDRLPI